MTPVKKARTDANSPASKVIAALPKLQVTGSEATDGERSANREMLITLLTECLADESHIMSLHTTLLKRKRSDTQDNGPDLIEPFSILGRIPDSERIDVLATISDFTTQELVQAKRQDAEVDRQLLTYALGLGVNVKVPPELRVRPVFYSFVRARARMMGDRLAKFKARGGLNKETGAVQWVNGCYTCEFDDKGVLSKVTHRATKSVAAAPACCRHVTTEWQLQSNWSDSQAQVQIKPAPPIALHTLWADKAGPNSMPVYKGGKANEVDAMIADLHRDHLAKLALVTSPNVSGDGPSTAEHLKQLRIDKQKAASKTAREKALQTLASRKAKRSIPLAKST